MQANSQVMVRLVLIMLLLGLLTACSTTATVPNNQLVRRALALQISQTQELLSQKFQSPPPQLEINRLVVKKPQFLVIGNLPAYRIQGTYDLTIKLPKRRIAQPQNSFEVYLQRQKEGKTWRLAVPESVSKNPNLDWRTYLIKPL